MKNELKSTLKYLKNKNNTRRIKAITITEAQKVVEEIERLHSIIKEIREYIEKTDTFQIIHSVDSWGEKLRDKTKKNLLEILDKVDKGK